MGDLWTDKVIGFFCCHSRGGKLCRKGSRGRKIAVGTFEAMSVAQLHTGIYLNRSQKYTSAFSGMLTALGAVFIILLSVIVFIDIFK